MLMSDNSVAMSERIALICEYVISATEALGWVPRIVILSDKSMILTSNIFPWWPNVVFLAPEIFIPMPKRFILTSEIHTVMPGKFSYLIPQALISMFAGTAFTRISRKLIFYFLNP